MKLDDIQIGQRYTFHFMWCCYALAWGIKAYDDSKMEKAA